MASLTIENYVKTIYQACLDSGGRASTGTIAERLGVSPGTVTSMLKTLHETDLVIYAPYEGVSLADAGRKLALHVLRRHRLIELFLVKTLGLSWDAVHDEAENMEHAVSEFLVDKIDEYLGFPAFDPHGDPIPNADGIVPVHDWQTLSTLQSGDRFRLVRVMDQTSSFLRYLSDNGLSLGATGIVGQSQVEAGIMAIDCDGDQKYISLATAEKLCVDTINR